MNTSSTNGITYFVTHSHRTYGDIQWDITANIPTARAYKKGTTTYHVAYNPTDDPLTVNFSDGTRFEVPARQMKVKERNYNSVTTIFTENEDTPDLREQLAMKNLALHKPCTASSYENEGCKPVGATDGDMESRWGSAHKDNEWLQVDLGENVSIYKVRIHWETAYPSEYRIELRSTENGSVTYSQTGNGKGNDWTELLMGDHTARYLRVVGVKRGTQYGTSLHEIEIYGRPTSAYDTDLMGVQITCDQAVLKQGQPATLNIQGYDYCCQPKNVTATWNSNDGSFNGNVFTPTNYGNVTVNAEVTVPGSSSQTLTVSKTFAVEEALYLATLTITPNPIIVPVGDDGVIVTVTGKNQFGAAMDIDPDNLTFRVCTYVQTGTWTDRNSNVHAIYSMTDTNAGTFNLSTLNVQNVGDYALIVSCPTAADTAFITARKLPDINLAYLKSIKSNSVNGGNKPELAVDGDTKTRWESLHGVNDVHITLDLQAVYNINKVRIVWEPAYAKSYDREL